MKLNYVNGFDNAFSTFFCAFPRHGERNRRAAGVPAGISVENPVDNVNNHFEQYNFAE